MELDWLDFRWREMSRSLLLRPRGSADLVLSSTVMAKPWACDLRWVDVPAWIRAVTLLGVLIQAHYKL